MVKIVKVLPSLEYQDRLDKDVNVSTLFTLYPTYTDQDYNNGISSSTICNLYGITDTFTVTLDNARVIFSDVRITFIDSSVDEYNKAFKFQITYKFEAQIKVLGSYVTAETGTITFDYEYKIMGY